jgi:hypothetical protein
VTVCYYCYYYYCSSYYRIIILEFLSLAHISEADVSKVIKRLKPSKSVELDDIPGFVIKGCSVIFIPILKHIFNLSLTQQYCPAVWKKAAVVPIFKRGNHAAVSNYRPISFLSNFLSCLN